MFNKDEYNYFIDELVRIRTKLNISIEQVAYECGVTGQTVRNFENGVCVNPVLLLYYLNKGIAKDNTGLYKMLISNCFE